MTRTEQLAWIAKYAPAAIASMQKWGVPASVTLAQAIVESSDQKGNWGQSGVALKCNNFFGIKARQGEDYIEFRSNKEEVNGKLKVEPAKFRKFQSVAQSFDRHGELLATLPRYAPAMAVAADPLDFALKLQLCGYSTNSKYAQWIASDIKRFNLTQYDKPQKEAA